MVRKGIGVVLLIGACCGGQQCGAAELEVVPGLSVRQEYTDNLFFAYKKEIEDFITTLSPQLQVKRRSERFEGSAGTRLDISFHRDNDEQDATDQEYSGTGRYALTERAGVSGSADLRVDSRPDRDLETAGLVQGSDTSRTWHYGLATDYRLSEISSARLGYDFGRTEYDDPDKVDYRTDAVALLYNRDLGALLPRTVGRSALQYIGYDMGASRIRNYSWTVGAEHRLNERWQVFGDLGARLTHAEFDRRRLVPTVVPGLFRLEPYTVADDGGGFIGELGLAFAGERAASTFSVRHGLEAASGRSGAVERTSLRGNYGYRLGERTRLQVGGEFFLNRSSDEEFATAAIDEQTLQARASFRYGFTKDLAAEVFYTYTRVEDRADDTERTRNLFCFRFLYNYGITL